MTGHNSAIDPTTLTPREEEVLSLLLTGATNKSIAQALNISSATVKYHVSNILQKLHVPNRAGIIVKILTQQQEATSCQKPTH